MSSFNPLKLKAKRVENGYSQEELSTLTKLSQTTLSSIETGKSSPNTDTLEKICSILKCRIEHFFDSDIPSRG